MKFKLEIDCSNAAFDDRDAEIARILRGVAVDASNGLQAGRYSLRDADGNTVGFYSLYLDAR